jgi:hypothetical protein
MFRAIGVAFGIATLERNNSGEGMTEPDAMTITDHSDVGNPVWNLRSKVAEHVSLIARSGFKKLA